MVEIRRDPRDALATWLEPFGLGAIKQALYGPFPSSWEWLPDDPEFGLWSPYYCDDCETFHSNWIALGFRIENGELWTVDCTWDNDGNFDPNSGIKVSSVEEIQAEESRAMVDSMNAQIEYYEYILETGNDPLGEFWPDHPTPIEDRVRQSIDSCKGVLQRLEEQQQAKAEPEE